MLSQAISEFEWLNHRQRALLQAVVRHPLQSYTIEGHATTHRVHYLTARSDLAKLVELGYLRADRVGKSKRFYPTDRLARLGKELPRRR